MTDDASSTGNKEDDEDEDEEDANDENFDGLNRDPERLKAFNVSISIKLNCGRMIHFINRLTMMKHRFYC